MARVSDFPSVIDRTALGRPSTRCSRWFNLRFDGKLCEKWDLLKKKGNFTDNTSFVSHLLTLEEHRVSSQTPR